MGLEHSRSAIALSEWIVAILVVIITVAITTSVRAILKNLREDRYMPIFRRLGPTASNILYIIGFRLAIDLAPFHGKVETWVSGGFYVLAVWIFLNFIRKAALIALEWSSLRTNNSETLRFGFIPLLRNLITLFVYFSGVIMVLKHFDYDVMSLVTAFGVSSLAVGLAAKDTLSNMIAGFILIIDRNLRPGDRINLTGMVGDVKEIGLRSTLIKVTDGNTLIVPNSDLVNTKILNLSLPTRDTACSAWIRVPYSIPFDRAKSLCVNILNQIHKTSSGKSPWVNLVSLSEGHQLIHIGFWVSDLNDANTAVSDFHERLLSAFLKEEIPLLPPSSSLALR